MPKAVFDSTVLVSSFLTKSGPSAKLLEQAQGGALTLCLAQEILDEVGRVLLDYPRIRKQYRYSNAAVIEYIKLLQIVAQMVSDLPKVRGVVRDPNDDVIIACALKAKAAYVVSRDKDLLDLGTYQRIKIISPEELIALLRQ